jgi:hypothetical protein
MYTTKQASDSALGGIWSSLGSTGEWPPQVYEGRGTASERSIRDRVFLPYLVKLAEVFSVSHFIFLYIAGA